MFFSSHNMLCVTVIRKIENGMLVVIFVDRERYSLAFGKISSGKKLFLKGSEADHMVKSGANQLSAYTENSYYFIE